MPSVKRMSNAPANTDISAMFYFYVEVLSKIKRQNFQQLTILQQLTAEGIA